MKISRIIHETIKFSDRLSFDASVIRCFGISLKLKTVDNIFLIIDKACPIIDIAVNTLGM